MIATRPLGSTGLEVSELAFGCSRLGAFWQGRSAREGVRAVHEALDAGITFFDTADCYARGLSERVLARALRGRRDRAVVATKVGSLKTPAALLRARGSAGSLRWLVPSDRPPKAFDPAYLERAVTASLRRLEGDTVDVLLLHSPPADVIRRGEFADTAARLRDRGTIRAFGISCDDAEEGLLAVAAPQVTCVQVPYGPAEPGAEVALLEAASRAGVAVVARAPFAGGAHVPAEAGALAETLRFPLRRSEVSCVLVGMSRPEHVRRNAAAMEVAARAG